MEILIVKYSLHASPDFKRTAYYSDVFLFYLYTIYFAFIWADALLKVIFLSGPQNCSNGNSFFVKQCLLQTGTLSNLKILKYSHVYFKKTHKEKRLLGNLKYVRKFSERKLPTAC